MACFLPLGCFFADPIHFFAQTFERISVKAGEDLSRLISANGIYRFPVFGKGVIVFKNAKKINASLNYNLLSGTMDFIGDKADTLSIGNPETIGFINLEKTFFYYGDGYMEVITDKGVLKLARKLKVRLESEKVGAYEQAAPASSISGYKNFYTATDNYNLMLNQNTIIIKEITFFWIDDKGGIILANKENTLKLFANKEGGIQQYAKQKHLDYRKEADLVELLDYYKELN